MEEYKFPDKNSRQQFTKIYDENEVKGMVESLGHQISLRFKGEKLVASGVLKGSFIFLADLIRQIHGVEIYVDFLKVLSLVKDKGRAGEYGLELDLHTSLSDKHVLLVTEILDSGRSISFLLQRLKLSQPKSIALAALFDKKSKRIADVECAFVGKKIDDHFLVGLGADLDEYCRNLNHIYFLKYPQ